ncbi:MAG: DUF748 domain-containing protein [Paludibacteraceae bacterium]|nr:DUF748 domain-containing protein [Paludibacteraceae bacterium]
MLPRSFKISLSAGAAIILLFLIAATLLSPIAKYIINHKGEALLGRELHAEKVTANLFNGKVKIHDFHCKELSTDTDFVSFEQLYVQIAYPQLLFKRVNIKHIHLNGFNGQVLQEKGEINFSDLIKRFSSDNTDDYDDSKWHVILDDIRISHSTVRYLDVTKNKHWELEDISMSVQGLDFGKKQTEAGLEFCLPTGGRVGISANYLMSTNIISIILNLYEVHSDVMLPLVQDYIDVSGLGAKLSGRLLLQAVLDNIQSIQVSGDIKMHGLCLKDGHNNEVASLNELRAVIDRCDINTNTYILDSLMLYGLTAKYEVHKNWNTLSRLLKSNEPVASLSKGKFSKSSKPLVWQARTAILTGHDITYQDYSMDYDWCYAIKSLLVEGKNVASNGRNSLRASATLTSNARLKGEFTGGLNFKRQNTRISLSLQNVDLRDFDAACRNYTGYPIISGILNLESQMNFISGQLDGNTKIIIENAQVDKREKGTKAPHKTLPVRSTVKMLSDSENRVIINAPVSADATRKKFNFVKILSKSLMQASFGRMMTTKNRKDKISEEELEEIRHVLSDDPASVEQDTSDQQEDNTTLSRREQRKKERQEKRQQRKEKKQENQQKKRNKTK